MNYRSDLANRKGRSIPNAVWDRSTLREDVFHRMIALERRRMQRSRRTVVLMLIEVGNEFSCRLSVATLGKVVAAIAKITRETDLTGWYRDNSVLGVMLTDVEQDEKSTATQTITRRLMRALQPHLTAEQQRALNISFEFISQSTDEDVVVRRAAASASAEASIPVQRAAQAGRKWAL